MKDKTFILAMRLKDSRLVLYKQNGQNIGEAATKLYEWLRAGGIIDLPSLEWSVELTNDNPQRIIML